MKKIYGTVTSVLAVLSFVLCTPVAANANYESDARVGFYPSTQTTPPVDPNNPDPNLPVFPRESDGSLPSSLSSASPNVGTGSPLSIDFVSTFEFDAEAMDEDEQTLFAKAQSFSDSKAKTPTYIQATDNRGTQSGWSLRVVENAQASKAKKEHQAYQGAMFSLQDAVAISSSHDNKPHVHEQADLIPDAQSVIATAPINSGTGTWVIRWGDQEDLLTKGDSVLTSKVQFIVPDREKKLTDYTTTLTWILSNLPVVQ